LLAIVLEIGVPVAAAKEDANAVADQFGAASGFVVVSISFQLSGPH
jgi:hypothetical protein